jgi:hypothetical protein
MWEEGAILKSDGDGYRAISSLWDRVPLSNEYISDRIIEHPDNADLLQEVWPIGKFEKAVFGTRKQAQAAAAALYKED